MISTALTMASKRVILTLEQRVNVIKKLDAGRSCRAVAQETGCGKTQITRIKQDRHEIMRDWQSGGRATIKIKRRTTPYEELNCLVWEWFCIARSKELPVSGRLIQVCDTLVDLVCHTATLHTAYSTAHVCVHMYALPCE